MAKTYIPRAVDFAHQLLLYLIRYQQALGLNLDEEELAAMNALINCLEAFLALVTVQENP